MQSFRDANAPTHSLLPPITLAPSQPVPSFNEVYRQWFAPVTRWLRALGGPDTDIEDLAQEVFVVVDRKLGSFDGRHLGAWLYRIVQLTLSDHRRRSWFVHLVQRREALRENHPDAGDDPHGIYTRQEQLRVFHRLVAKLPERQRQTFLLYEVLGHSGDELAQLQQVPINTIWTRLHAARKRFMKLVKEELAQAATPQGSGKQTTKRDS